jgi:hypothetical protein
LVFEIEFIKSPTACRWLQIFGLGRMLSPVFRSRPINGIALTGKLRPVPPPQLFDTKTRSIHMWHHYLEIYEQYLSRYKGKPCFFWRSAYLMGDR